MKFRILAAVALVAIAAVFLANRHMRLGRDLIFHSDDVTEFTLSNGKVVHTNRWYDQADLLDEGQDFYLAPNGLGIMSPKVDGFAMTTDEEGESGYLRILRTNTTVEDLGLAVIPVGQKAIRDGVYDEYWVSGQDAEARK